MMVGAKQKKRLRQQQSDGMKELENRKKKRRMDWFDGPKTVSNLLLTVISS